MLRYTVGVTILYLFVPCFAGVVNVLKWNGNEYYHGTNDVTWKEARDVCRGIWGQGNGDLVTVNDANENDYIFNLVKNNGKRNTWIGANDIIVEGKFIWTDNCPVQFTRWAKNEPNNLGKEDCAHLWGDAAGTWNDMACNSKQRFFCERKKPTDMNCGDPLAFKWNNVEHYFGKRDATWQEARDFCRGYWGQGNGDLVTINDINKNNFLFDLVKNNGKRNTWIGANDINLEGNFIWTDNCPVQFTRWAQNEPNDLGKEDCAHLFGDAAGAWNDIACNTKQWFFCERKKTDANCGDPLVFKWNNGEHYFGKRDATWQEARDFCRGYWGKGNGDLVTINDINKNNFLFDLVKNNGKRNTWIGANDIIIENFFIWTDNCPVQFTRWAQNEPNNLGKEDCAHFWGDAAGTWNDIACSTKQWFFCERKRTDVNCGDPLVFKWNNGDHYFGKRDATWQEARDFCRGYWGQGNGDLVTINDINKNNFLFDLVKNNGKQNTWIGANDITLEGNFIWTDNCPVQFTRWAQNEPNNLGNEDCAHFWGDAAGTWNDLACSTKQWFFCERKNSNMSCGDPLVFKNNGNEYYFGKRGNTWQEARDFCLGYWGQGNGDLVTINDNNENNYLFEIIKKNGKQNTFIGGNDLVRKRKWTWNDNCPFEFTRWAQGEPNNMGGNEDCAHIWGDAAGTWNDVACSSKFFFICKRKRIDLKCGKVRPILPFEINFEEIGFLQSENYDQYFVDAKVDLSAWIEFGRRDAFRIVKGLAGGRTVSFESVRKPGHFLRHENALLWLHPPTKTDLFKNDASFFVEENENGFLHLRSVNFPDLYVRHQNFGLKLQKDDGSALFQKDKSFKFVLLANKEGKVGYQLSVPPNDMKFGGRFEFQSVTPSNLLQEKPNKTLWFGTGNEGLQLRIVKGLSGANTVSLESNKYRGWYLRHQNYVIKLNELDNTELFKQDSSFSIEDLANGQYRFQSLNHPLHYIRINGNQLNISQIDNSEASYLTSCFKTTRYVNGKSKWLFMFL